jgi:hypothetical protein
MVIIYHLEDNSFSLTFKTTYDCGTEPELVNLGIDSQLGEIDFFESIPGLLKSLQIRVLLAKY